MGASDQLTREEYEAELAEAGGVLYEAWFCLACLGYSRYDIAAVAGGSPSDIAASVRAFAKRYDQGDLPPSFISWRKWARPREKPLDPIQGAS